MLDEIKAYEEYTCDLTKHTVCRLNIDVFKHKNHLNGLSGAMIVIARYELADRGYFIASVDEQRVIIEEVKECLRSWTGFVEDTSCDVSYYKDWFKNYYIERILPLDISSDKSEIKPWERIVKDRKKQFETTLINQDEVAGNSNIQITYERIIADAIYLGPLKKYLLVLKKGALGSLTYNGKQVDLSKKKAKEKIDNTLRLIAAYLLKRQYTGNFSNVVNTADLANWAQCASIFKDKNEYYKSVKYGDAPIFESKTVAGNVTKVFINQDFLFKYDFRIISESDCVDISDDYLICLDKGSGTWLLPENL